MRNVLCEISNQFLLQLRNHYREYGIFLYKQLLLPVNDVISTYIIV